MAACGVTASLLSSVPCRASDSLKEQLVLFDNDIHFPISTEIGYGLQSEIQIKNPYIILLAQIFKRIALAEESYRICRDKHDIGIPVFY